MERKELVDLMVTFLNRVLQVDPEGFTKLWCVRVGCKRELEDVGLPLTIGPSLSLPSILCGLIYEVEDSDGNGLSVGRTVVCPVHGGVNHVGAWPGATCGLEIDDGVHCDQILEFGVYTKFQRVSDADFRRG